MRSKAKHSVLTSSCRVTWERGWGWRCTPRRGGQSRRACNREISTIRITSISRLLQAWQSTGSIPAPILRILRQISLLYFVKVILIKYMYIWCRYMMFENNSLIKVWRRRVLQCQIWPFLSAAVHEILFVLVSFSLFFFLYLFLGVPSCLWGCQ